ncbi:RimK family alpha-L-glutamate ligase [Gramella sp. KN1008]|uniref:ATP-grasp domain-containing protein n=1 Tax=Gramella sp. KN1008 TaxID=2529298 RepID=UPI00103D36C4|nr:hypothetical protein [Gramella sp. KN1008]TBW28246.1 hypothetical protein EZJ28_05735 [Gramella sp. KN1008]
MLSDAAVEQNIEPVKLESEYFDYSKLDELEAGPGDMFYNVTPFSHEIENILISKEIKSFFINPNIQNYIFSTHQLDLSLISANIPVPKTILKGSNKRELLQNYVDYLGGFPLILKVTGGTLGVGVIKVESWENLISTADMLSSKSIHFQLKQYIPNNGTIRAIVVGDKVVCSIIRLNPENDFRCSAPGKSSIIEIYNCSEELEKLAIKVSQAVKFEFVGIDFIQDIDGKYYVLEVNFPNDFSIPANFTGVNVAKYVVNHLNEK